MDTKKYIIIAVTALSFSSLFMHVASVDAQGLTDIMSEENVRERQYWYSSYTNPGTRLPNGQTVPSGSNTVVLPTSGAQSGSASVSVGMDFRDFVNFLLSSVITPLFSIFLGAAVVFFLWNMLQMVKNSTQEEERAKMKEQAIWGVVAIAVMISMWGLVNFFTGSLRLNNNPVNLDRFSQPIR